jgi:Resolvase, N terminal domain
VKQALLASARSRTRGPTPHGQLMLTILGGLAEFERTLIRGRTGEGRERARTRGVRFGRPKKLTVHQRHEAIERINAGGSRRGCCQDVWGQSRERLPTEGIAAHHLGADGAVRLTGLAHGPRTRERGLLRGVRNEAAVLSITS